MLEFGQSCSVMCCFFILNFASVVAIFLNYYSNACSSLFLHSFEIFLHLPRLSCKQSGVVCSGLHFEANCSSVIIVFGFIGGGFHPFGCFKSNLWATFSQFQSHAKNLLMFRWIGKEHWRNDICLVAFLLFTPSRFHRHLLFSGQSYQNVSGASTFCSFF